MNSSSNDETSNELFTKAMLDVTPLAQTTKKVLLNKQSRTDQASMQLRRQLATQEPLPDQNFLATEHVPRLHPQSVLEYRKGGVQEGVYRKLRLGKYPMEARLDLHRKTLNQARTEVFDFIYDAIKYDLRTLMILHGKGDRSDNKALIKSFVAFWLKQIPEVLAYHSAQRHQGGTGALYVLLKKSDRKKQETRDCYMNKKF